jgi:hypothetical protein
MKPMRHRVRTALVLVLLAGALGTMLLLSARRGEGDARTPVAHRDSSGGGERKQCSVTVSSLDDVQSEVSSASPGATVCLRSGSYGKLTLDTEKTTPGVTVRAENPGKAAIAGADLSGIHLTLARFDVTDEITIEPGSRHVSVVHNRIGGGYFGVEAGPTTTTSISDTTIRDNLFAGPFGEDAIRLNRYHDSSDPDPYGILIEGNEFTGIRENGSHSDCLQSVWGGDGLYFRRNYLHDNRCQGFFVKDQPAPVSHIVVQNNLMLRNAAPCATPPGSGCGPPVILHIFGPTAGVRIARNTVWTPSDRSPVTLREGPFGRVVMTRNVIFRGWSDWTGGFPNFTEKENTVCEWEATLPPLSKTSTRDCTPAFRDPAEDDYRVRGDRGVDWAPRNQHYGP